MPYRKNKSQCIQVRTSEQLKGMALELAKLHDRSLTDYIEELIRKEALEKLPDANHAMV